MLEIPVSGVIKMQNVISEYNLESYSMTSVSIGNDDRIYCLWRREQRLREPAKHLRYLAISFDVNWYSGEVYGSELHDFGVRSDNIYFIRPIGENFLLIGFPLITSTMPYEEIRPDENALVVDRNGNTVRSFHLGDGLQSCIVDSQKNIIASYYAGKKYPFELPISPRIIKWSETGEKLWEVNKEYDIDNLFAMNVDEQDNLWFRYDTYWGVSCLVKTDYQSDIDYAPNIKGSYDFLIPKSQAAILFHMDHWEEDYCIMEMNNNRLMHSTDAKLVSGGNEISIWERSFRSSKAVFESDNEDLFFLDWIHR
jgi:hypothetical protein